MTAQPRSAATRRAATHRVLVVDDSRLQRRLLRARLEARGYEVAEAGDGTAAARLLSDDPVPLVICDWMMPGMDGPALCRWLRHRLTRDDRPYTYVILLTAKDAQADIAAGLAAGADDFLSKPVSEGELAARLASGARVVGMQARLLHQSAALSRAYDELKAAHERMEQDLGAAARLQRAAEPPALAERSGFAIAAAYRPAGHVGGDHIGHFEGPGRQIGAFSIDVSGHGVASALETVRLAELMRPGGEGEATRLPVAGPAGLGDPHSVIAALNALHLEQSREDLYFTMAYAVIEAETGHGRLCRAGHAEPLILRRDGRVETLSHGGGPPVGLLPYERFESVAFRLDPGDRLLLHSDGLTETAGPDGEMLDSAGLARHLAACRCLATGELLPALVAAVAAETGGFADDVSALLIEAPLSPGSA